jgi:hypothetical protein
MAWHHALDVRVEADCYFCEKTLRNYRRLFMAEGLDEALFRCMTDRLVRAFSVDNLGRLQPRSGRPGARVSKRRRTGLHLCGERKTAGALRSCDLQGVPEPGPLPSAGRQT